MRPCTNCIKAGERYIANRAYNKCAGCVRTAKASCDLVVSQKNWDKLNNKRVRLSKAVCYNGTQGVLSPGYVRRGARLLDRVKRGGA